MLVHWSHCIATNPWCSPRLLAHGPIIVWIHILRREEQVALARVSKHRILTNSEDSERKKSFAHRISPGWIVWMFESKSSQNILKPNEKSTYHQTIIKLSSNYHILRVLCCNFAVLNALICRVSKVQRRLSSGCALLQLFKTPPRTQGLDLGSRRILPRKMSDFFPLKMVNIT